MSSNIRRKHSEDASHDAKKSAADTAAKVRQHMGKMRPVDCLGIIGFAVIAVAIVAANTKDEPASDKLSYMTPEPVSVSPGTPLHQEVLLRNDVVACYNQDVLKRYLDSGYQKDPETFHKAMLQDIVARQCLLLRSRQSVYIEDIDVWSNVVKIKVPGQTEYMWTFQKAVD